MFLCVMFMIFFIISLTPMALILTIIGQSFSFIYTLSTLNNLIWFSLILIMIYMGGIMMVFLYINSVSNKLILKQSNKFLLLLPAIFISHNMFFYLLNGEMNLNFMFYSMKEFFFLFFMVFLIFFIYLLNNILLNVKNPLNSSL